MGDHNLLKKPKSVLVDLFIRPIGKFLYYAQNLASLRHSSQSTVTFIESLIKFDLINQQLLHLSQLFASLPEFISRLVYILKVYNPLFAEIFNQMSRNWFMVCPYKLVQIAQVHKHVGQFFQTHQFKSKGLVKLSQHILNGHIDGKVHRNSVVLLVLQSSLHQQRFVGEVRLTYHYFHVVHVALTASTLSTQISLTHIQSFLAHYQILGKEVLPRSIL